MERLRGETKSAARFLGADTIGAKDRAMRVTIHLRKRYGIDAIDQLHIDTACFFDFHWKPNMSIEKYIAGFNACLDKLLDFSVSDKIKGQLLLHQADLDSNPRNIIVGSESGCYEIGRISNSVRQAFRNSVMEEGDVNIVAIKNSNNRRYYGNHAGGNENRRSEPGRSIFYTYKTSKSDSIPSAIIDSGACTSVVGKETLDLAI